MDSVDTNVLVRALLKITPGNPNNGRIYGSRKILRDLMKKNGGFIIPAPVLSEFLASTDDDGKRARAHNLLRNTGFVYPFDDAAALLAARVYQKLLTNKSSQAWRFGSGSLAKEVVKTDIYIATTSVIFGAKTLHTDDESDFRDICDALKDLSYPLNLKRPDSDCLILDDDPFESI